MKSSIAVDNFFNLEDFASKNLPVPSLFSAVFVCFNLLTRFTENIMVLTPFAKGKFNPGLMMSR